eukprot:872854-Heterocapsa_arctica.AAC.1
MPTRTGHMGAWTRYRASRQPAVTLEGEADRTKWSSSLRAHYSTIYTDNSPTTTTWVHNQKKRLSQTIEGIRFTVAEVRLELNKMKSGRTAARDGVT